MTDQVFLNKLGLALFITLIGLILYYLLFFMRKEL